MPPLNGRKRSFPPGWGLVKTVPALLAASALQDTSFASPLPPELPSHNRRYPLRRDLRPPLVVAQAVYLLLDVGQLRVAEALKRLAAVQSAWWIDSNRAMNAASSVSVSW